MVKIKLIINQKFFDEIDFKTNQDVHFFTIYKTMVFRRTIELKNIYRNGPK